MMLALLLATALPPAAAAASPATELMQVSERYVEKQRRSEQPAGPADFAATSFLSEIAEQEEELARLLAIDPGGLSREQDIDRRLLIGIFRSDINTARTVRRWASDPGLYLPSASLAQLFEPAFAGTEDERREQLTTLLEALPERLAHGRANLERPARWFSKEALFQARNSLQTLEQGLAATPVVPDAVATQARKALKDYVAFLETELLPRSDGRWALGREAYDYILRERWHMDSDAKRIHRRGEQAFRETEAQLGEVAARMQPGRHWTEVYESLKDDHPSSDGLKQAYQQQMDAARQFVLEHSLLTLPDGERVVTLDTPPALRRSSPFGTFEMADPFDGSLEGRLYLTPVENWMSPEEQARRLRAHHRSWIPVIAVHEAYPGHHAHALKINQNPNLLRRVVNESILSEGWGLYTEELMYRQGFLAGDDVRLTQLRNRLWRAARVILDSGLHSGMMTFDEAVAFLVERVRFDAYAAELEVGMYIRNPTYVLGYLIGMQELEALYEEYVQRHGEPQPPSLFYDRLLGIGAIPPALLREELLP